MTTKRLFALTLTALLAVTAWRPVCAAEDPAHDFARWEKEINAFEQMDRTNPPPRGAILFAGSSTIRMWTTLAQDFPKHHVINRGFGGSEICDSTHFASRIIFPYAPKMIFLRAGGNDLANGKSPEQVFADFKDFVTTVHARLPETTILFIAWNATPSRWDQHEKEQKLNGLVEEYAKHTPGVKSIDAYSISLDADGKPRPELFQQDHLHFNAAGYKLLTERVRPYLPQ